ncbi:hypothetical protein ACFL6K_03110 [Candidatus Latescibacterota bacterium]
MKKIILLSIVSILLFANCIFDGDDNKDDNGNQMSVENYLPSTLNGSKFTLHSTKGEAIASVHDTLTYAVTISGPVTMDGHEYYTMVSTDNSETGKFCVEANSIYLCVEEFMFPEVGNNPDTPFGTNVKLIDFSASPGDSYDILEWGTTNDEYHINYTVSGEFVGYETVQTPYADFEDCAKFQIQIDAQLTPVVSGGVINTSHIESLWFAPDTGVVKRSIMDNSGFMLYFTDEVLIAFNR